MSTALYRRYRPETFDEVIGQEHVTEPLKAAIERGRINHAYLFSGPRGCGKTTSARILARCLNCEKGPTPVPCGECPSCQDLANGGPGSLDVVEIDAASHNGVDDARDLRERAIYAPARDRFKVFILDEAHMVTSQGFNALLKIVEEPPPHIKFIFATTEPEKVIGTIRSRTHHYPFRLVPPEALGNYLDDLCGREGVQVAKGVLPLVVRAGGGSVRDTLSVLDQLIAGSGPDGVDYGRAIALLGYTPDSLLSDIVDAFSAGDGGGVYRAVERVIESGQDPRRFVEDLLERFRDLIVINAAPEAAHAFLPEVPPDRLERLTLQASGFGQGELSRAADLLNHGLTEMSGATSPRLQLELICARILLPGSGRSRDAVLSRVERMERRIGMSATGTAANIPPAQTAEPAQTVEPAQGGAGTNAGNGPAPVAGQAPAVGQDSGAGQDSAGGTAPRGSRSSTAPAPAASAAHDDFDDITAMAVAAESMLNEPDRSEPGGNEPDQPSTQRQPVSNVEAEADEPSPQSSAGTPAPSPSPVQEEASVARREEVSEARQEPTHVAEASSEPAQPQPQPQSLRPQADASQFDASQAGDASAPEATSVSGPGEIGGEIEAIRRAWPSILAAVEKRSRLTRAIIAANAIPQSFTDGVVYLGFNNQGSVQGFRQRDHAAKLAMAIDDVLGIQARIDVGDVGRISGSGGDTRGAGSPAPTTNDAGGNRGPAPSQRRPSPQEVAAVVGTREVDKPQVDHEKFWEPRGHAEGPWSSDDEEGEQQAPTDSTPEAETPSGADSSPETDHVPDRDSAPDPDSDSEPEVGEPSAEREPSGDAHEAAVDSALPAIDSAAADTAAADTAAADTTAADTAGDDSAESEIVVPDLSDDDFFADPAENGAGTAAQGAESSALGAEAQPTQVTHVGASDSQDFDAEAHRQDEAPMEYVQPRWEEPTWHDGSEIPPMDNARADVDSTSAGSGAVDVGAVVVPPPDDDDLDYLDDLGDSPAAQDAGLTQPASPQSGSPQGNGGAKPFKSRFAALAEKHGGATPQPPAPSYGAPQAPNGHSAYDTGGPAGGPGDSAPQPTGSDEDEYDPETDLDVSEAPQIGVDVIARVLGGEVIDEREV